MLVDPIMFLKVMVVNCFLCHMTATTKKLPIWERTYYLDVTPKPNNLTLKNEGTVSMRRILINICAWN